MLGKHNERTQPGEAASATKDEEGRRGGREGKGEEAGGWPGARLVGNIRKSKDEYRHPRGFHHRNVILHYMHYQGLKK